MPQPGSGRKRRKQLEIIPSGYGVGGPSVLVVRVQSLGQEDPLEEGMATHSSIHAWRIQWTEKTGKL